MAVLFDTGWSGLKDECIEKYLRAIIWYGYGITSIDFYGRTSPYGAGTLHEMHTITTQSEPVFSNCDDLFREIRLKFHGTSGYVKGVKILYDSRRF